MTKDPHRIAERLSQLDRDGIAIMLDPPERIPAYLVRRLCEPKPLVGQTPGKPASDFYRPPLVEERGELFRLNDLGRRVAVLLLSEDQTQKIAPAEAGAECDAQTSV